MQEQRGGPTTTRNQRREREREERCHLPTRPQHAALRSVKPRVPKEWVCDLGLGLGPGGATGTSCPEQRECESTDQASRDFALAKPWGGIRVRGQEPCLSFFLGG